MGRWQPWLLSGLALVCALAALSVAAEETWKAGHPHIADLIGVSRLALYWLWFVPAWKILRSAKGRLLVHAARTTLAAGLVVTVLT
jgi:hypothetical protein